MLEKLRRTISADRLTRYLIATRGDLGCAIKLYEINIQLSQTLYGVLHGYEITLQNAMHDRLTQHFGQEDWYSQANLSQKHAEMVEKAIGGVAGDACLAGASIPTGKVVAELGLGFWTGLIAAGYEQSLWGPCLRKAFPNSAVPRWRVFTLLNDIKSVRNRVAHHERILGSHGTLYAGLHPIHRTELTLHPQAILDCVGWICPDTSGWIRATCRFDDCISMLNSDPLKTVRFS